MAVSPEYKYTDTDVRKNPDLIALAVEYLRDYAGEFEYLVDAKRILVEVGSGALTVSQIRGVLNCMRHDLNVAGKLYQVAPPTKTVEEILRPRVRPLNEIMSCAEVNPHSPHQVSDTKRCMGVTKSRIDVPATIKTPYCKAKNGKLIHKPRGEAVAVWVFKSYTANLYYVELHVKLRCKYPSWIIDPLLIKEEPTIGELELLGLDYCSRCEDGEDVD